MRKDSEITPVRPLVKLSCFAPQKCAKMRLKGCSSTDYRRFQVKAKVKVCLFVSVCSFYERAGERNKPTHERKAEKEHWHTVWFTCSVRAVCAWCQSWECWHGWTAGWQTGSARFDLTEVQHCCSSPAWETPERLQADTERKVVHISATRNQDRCYVYPSVSAAWSIHWMRKNVEVRDVQPFMEVWCCFANAG